MTDLEKKFKKLKPAKFNLVMGENNLGKTKLLNYFFDNSDDMTKVNHFAPIYQGCLGFESIVWKLLSSDNIKELKQFGRLSGLFDDFVSHKKPFQLSFKIRDKDVDFRTIGNGLKRVFPLLCYVLPKKGHKIFLENPGSGLNPRALAELTSVFIKNTKHNSYFIETHNDQMIDRTRIEISRGNILPKDVCVFWFMLNKNGKHRIYTLTFDKMANFNGTPKRFRQWFLEESDRFLFGDRLKPIGDKV